MSKKIIILIVLIIVLILLAVLIVFSMSNLDKENNLNEADINKISSINSMENNMSEDVQNVENQSNTGAAMNNQNNTQTVETNNEHEISNEGSENMNSQSEEIKVNLIVNNKTFSATLDNNETTRELVSMFPITLNMSDLHSNEKYNYLDTSLPTNSSTPSKINAGDIKLYGNNCLVVFYESFSNSYSYTDLGRIDDVNTFVSELGRGSVSIRFELAQ